MKTDSLISSSPLNLLPAYTYTKQNLRVLELREGQEAPQVFDIQEVSSDYTCQSSSYLLVTLQQKVNGINIILYI